MIFGYHLDIFYEYGLKIPVEIAIESHCHALITGASGSGKSKTLSTLLGSALKSEPKIQLTFCDFKNSDDFRYLRNFRNFYAGENCYAGISEFYNKFCTIRESGQPERRQLLIIDEYPALISFLQTRDKNNKTKEANDILSMVSEILMLGRGLNTGIWIVTQRADSSWFQAGSRDNFMIRCALGNISKEQRTMLFSGEELPERIYKAGEGILHADGKELLEVKFPKIIDIEDWKKHILEILCPDDEA